MRSLFWLILCLAMFPGCKVSKVYQLPIEDEQVAANREWGQLKARCDANGDGVVERNEYDGGDEEFERLDRDGDGRLTGLDFKRGGAGGGTTQPAG